MNDMIIERLKEEKNRKESCAVECRFIDFEQSYQEITKMLGDEGFIMISESIAIACYDKTNWIKIYIKNDKKLNVENFNFVGTKVNVIGEEKAHNKTFISLLIPDIVRLLWLIIPTLLIYLFLFTSDNADIDVVKSLDEVLITVFSIFIATIFVFIST